MWDKVDKLEGLKDIKGLLVIEDYSLYIFIVIVLVCLILLYFIIKKIIIRFRVKTAIKIAKQKLKNIDLSDSKKSAYMISKYAPYLSQEDFSYLEKYKYKKHNREYEPEDLANIKRFLDGI